MELKFSGEEMTLAQALTNVQDRQKPLPPLILIVEDNDDNLLLLNYTLESLGCRLISQKDSSAAVVLAKEHLPDLILLDILMPGLTGIDIIRHLKQEPLTRNITTIAVTALASADDRETILNAGFDDYISKPYMIEDVENMVMEYLGKKNGFLPIS